MSKYTEFPLQPMAEGMSAPDIKLEGQKVLFDKKVSLLPVDTKKVPENGKSNGAGV
ncbi:hypothetical protein C900_01241 [Fulvivirga imtechensis AK7]|uniref:Uncharacterized protein n=1 Tax=Fulvivirga imtechensis AK7 TaxID=1237149 RepID=L8JZE3_9BACT|nr:hypothetical protein [Fulvivirga imtechensis]ELR72567.1 hypothetical protein C900_01241 [Fulvivirga imtechensis AK7]